MARLVPELVVTSVDRPEIDGRYELQMDGAKLKLHHGRPVYACGLRRIFVDHNGDWKVTPDTTGQHSMERGEGTVGSGHVGDGHHKLPHQVTRWMRWNHAPAQTWTETPIEVAAVPRLWRPESHHLFPKAFRFAARAAVQPGPLKDLPRELLYHCLGFSAPGPEDVAPAEPLAPPPTHPGELEPGVKVKFHRRLDEWQEPVHTHAYINWPHWLADGLEGEVVQTNDSVPPVFVRWQNGQGEMLGQYWVYHEDLERQSAPAPVPAAPSPSPPRARKRHRSPPEHEAEPLVEPAARRGKRRCKKPKEDEGKDSVRRARAVARREQQRARQRERTRREQRQRAPSW